MSKPVLNPKTTHLEFSGLPGALAISIGLPAVLILFELLCNRVYLAQGISLNFAAIKDQLPNSWEAVKLLVFDPLCWKAYVTWFFTLAACDVWLPGQTLKGVPLRDGTRLTYKINGIAMLILFIAVLVYRWYTCENHYMPELAFVYNNMLQLTLTTIVFAWLLAVFVYVCSFIPLRKPNGVGTHERVLSINGNSGNVIYDWFIGRELNPRIGPLDIKLYCELKPGMLLWLLINLLCCHYQYHTQGLVSDSLALVTAMQMFYTFDGVLNEAGVLLMMDVTTDGFGFMLSFGDLALVPWLYSLQLRFLCLPENRLDLGWPKVIGIAALMALGFYIFRLANKQKSDFKNGKLDHKNFKLIKTETGSKLLCDGWWGLSQHINYFGDWLIGWLWCLPTGFQLVLPYYYVIYFGALLIHRQMRDEAKCRAKYKKLWVEYERQVPYKIIPYVY